ncbi:Sigma-70 family RNA polymerase sigma factor OS=Streptomyces tendae OX=1932 GN=F3L20_02200 PE=3 SV=1 [Streptomyces tendae]
MPSPPSPRPPCPPVLHALAEGSAAVGRRARVVLVRGRRHHPPPPRRGQRQRPHDELVERAQAGEADAFGRLCHDQYSDTVNRSDIYYRVGGKATAED